MRNPYTRMISCYECQFPRELNHYHLPNEDDHLTFDRYVEIIIEGVSMAMMNIFSIGDHKQIGFLMMIMFSRC